MEIIPKFSRKRKQVYATSGFCGTIIEQMYGGGTMRLFEQPKGFYKSMLTVAVPIALQNLINYSLALADTMMLGAVGQNEIAGASVVNSSFFVVMLMVFGFQSGASVLISQYFGKKDTQTISRVIGLSFMTAFTIVTVFSAIAMIYPRALVSIFTNDQVAIDLGVRYMRIVAIAYPINIFTQVYVGAHRSMGNAKLGLGIYSSAMIVNTFLNWVLIFGKLGAPKLGMEGAAIATVIARVVELIITILYCKYNKRFKFDIKAALRPGKELTRDFVRYATPVVMNETMWGLGTSLLPAIYGRMGTDILAAVTVSRNIENIAGVFAFGFAGATAVIIGTQLGAGKHTREEIYHTGKTMLAISVISGSIAGVGLICASMFITPIFALPASTKLITSSIIMFYALRAIPSQFNTTCIVGVLRGGGDTRRAMLVDIFPLWIVNLPITALLGLYFKFPIGIVLLPCLLEDITKVTLGLTRFRSRAWINNITR